jgi:hypothetical protein
MLTARSKRSHASGSNAGSSTGLLLAAFVFFIGHLFAALCGEVTSSGAMLCIHCKSAYLFFVYKIYVFSMLVLVTVAFPPQSSSDYTR